MSTASQRWSWSDLIHPLSFNQILTAPLFSKVFSYSPSWNPFHANRCWDKLTRHVAFHQSMTVHMSTRFFWIGIHIGTCRQVRANTWEAKASHQISFLLGDGETKRSTMDFSCFNSSQNKSINNGMVTVDKRGTFFRFSNDISSWREWKVVMPVRFSFKTMSFPPYYPIKRFPEL